MTSAVLVLAVVTTGLYAGVMYAFQFIIMPTLGRGSDAEFTAVMRRINQVIVNPWFLVLFLGIVLWPLLAVVLAEEKLLAALALGCTVLAHLVTVAGNIPLNEALGKAPVATPEERLAAREAFEARWLRLHAVRTLLCVVAAVLLACAALAR
ncbi:DUF1772 domain-containing protein [Streptomyces polyrhachis]|uniref:DUF1772 domain-containing protein n=1 Tax=Streptomyces polyrhachis TaxID=1282885 RepID=A0ABW2GL72_9ACTN